MATPSRVAEVQQTQGPPAVAVGVTHRKGSSGMTVQPAAMVPPMPGARKGAVGFSAHYGACSTMGTETDTGRDFLKDFPKYQIAPCLLDCLEPYGGYSNLKRSLSCPLLQKMTPDKRGSQAPNVTPQRT